MSEEENKQDLSLDADLIRKKEGGNGLNRYYDFSREIRREISEYDHKSKPKDNDVSVLENLVIEEKMTLIKAFVNDSGEIDKEYSLIQKGYLGLVKKISDKGYKNAKSKIDDRIIEKCAKKKLAYLAGLSNKAVQYAEMTSNKRDYCVKKHSNLSKEYSEELRASERFQGKKEVCKKHLEELSFKLKADDTDSELIDTYFEMKKDYDALNQRFRRANLRANSIKERMEVNYPQYVITELYAETFIEEALSLSVAHEFYTNLYDDLKKARALNLKEFMEWNENMENFLGDYNKEADNSSKQIVSLLGSYRKSGDLLNGEPVLEKYRNAIQETHEKLLERLKDAKKNMLGLEL